jgi:hypothetical protein
MAKPLRFISEFQGIMRIQIQWILAILTFNKSI